MMNGVFRFDVNLFYWAGSAGKHCKKISRFPDVYKNLLMTQLCTNSSEASPTIWSCYANLNHYHYSFL